MCQVVCDSYKACFIRVHRTMLCGWWLCIQSKEFGIVFLVGSAPTCKALQIASTAHCSNKANPTLQHTC